MSAIDFFYFLRKKIIIYSVNSLRLLFINKYQQQKFTGCSNWTVQSIVCPKIFPSVMEGEKNEEKKGPYDVLHPIIARVMVILKNKIPEKPA